MENGSSEDAEQEIALLGTNISPAKVCYFVSMIFPFSKGYTTNLSFLEETFFQSSLEDVSDTVGPKTKISHTESSAFYQGDGPIWAVKPISYQSFGNVNPWHGIL